MPTTRSRTTRSRLPAAVTRHPAHRYAVDVLAGRIVACKWVKLACQRYMDDLRDGRRRGIHFVPEAAQIVIDYVEQMPHVLGEMAGQLMLLEPWQQFIVWNLYGWYRADGSRRFHVAYLSMARKQGKSWLGAALANYHTHGDAEPGARVYAAATKKDQARELFDMSAQQIRLTPELAAEVTVLRSSIEVASTNSRYTMFSRDFKTEDGRNPSFAIVDEYHAHPDAGVFDVLKSGMVRPDAMLVVITTAGFDPDYPCHREQKERAEPILEGTIEDDSYFAIIYTLDDPDAEWTKEGAWIKSNPNLDISVTRRFLQEQVREAQQSPAKQNAIKTKNFNIWTQAVTRWLTAESWEACNRVPFTAASLRGRRCYGGIDMSRIIDLSAYVLDFPPSAPGEPYKELYWFWMPEARVREAVERDRVPYDVWVREGLITPIPGNAIDISYVKKTVLETSRLYRIGDIAYDPAGSAQPLAIDLQDHGVSMVEFPPNFKRMSPATKQYERDVVDTNIAAGGHKVMVWMIGCTEVAQNADGDIKPVKPNREKSSRRIDGPWAAILAHWRSVLNFNDRPPEFINDRTPPPTSAGLRGMQF